MFVIIYVTYYNKARYKYPNFFRPELDPQYNTMDASRQFEGFYSSLMLLSLFLQESQHQRIVRSDCSDTRSPSVDI
jgi:hypothetical protein